MDLLVPDERLARRVGVIGLCVMAAAIGAFVFLHDRLELGAPTRIQVMFRHVAGLRERAPLVIGGQPIGRVEAISPVTHAAGGPFDGEVGVAAGVVVTVAIAEGHAWKVPARAEIFVASRGPLSEKYLEVAPPDGEPGPAVQGGQALRGIDPPTLDNVLQHTWANMTTFKLFVETVRPELERVRTRIAELRATIDAIASEAHASGGGAGLLREAAALASAARATYDTALGGEPGLQQLRQTVKQARAAIGELRVAIDALAPRASELGGDIARLRGELAARDPAGRAAQAIETARAVIDRIDPLLARIDELGDRIARAEGSLGRLMSDPEFPEDAKELGKIIKRHPWRILERPAD